MKKKPKVAFIKLRNKMQETTKSKTIVENIKTLHGTSQFSKKSGRAISLWSALMVANIFGTIAFIFIIKDRYQNDQIVTKIYSDWSVEKVPFPAISICNFNIVSLNEAKNIERILLKHDVTQKEIELFFHDTFFLKNFGLHIDTVGNHTAIMNVLKTHYFNMDTIMEETNLALICATLSTRSVPTLLTRIQLHQQCNNLLLYCEFNGKIKQCEEIFKKIKTAEGYCCTFNYNGVDDIDPTSVHDDDFDYYYDEDSDGSLTKTAMVATSQSGKTSGLRVVLNIHPADYADWAPTRAYGAKILVSDPNDFPEIRTVYKYVTLGESLDLKVEPKIYSCEPSVRSVELSKRGCWFHDEVNLKNTARYSYETCCTECRINSYINFCGCVPYKYPMEQSARVCELSDLECLNYMIVHWSTTRSRCEPLCFKECSDKEYSVFTDSTPFMPHYFPDNVTNNRNISELTALHVYFIRSTCNCYMMSLLIDFNYFIATYGGIFSLSFGASILTILELIYLSMSALLSFTKSLSYAKTK